MWFGIVLVALTILLGPSLALGQTPYTGSRGGGGSTELDDLQRPFDASDLEMQQLMRTLHTGTGCGKGTGQRCSEREARFAGGGDRLARYLIEQFEASLREGYPDRLTYLSYVAYTHSEAGFQYLTDRVRNRSDLSADDAETAIHALGKTADARAIDEILRVLRDEVDDPRERSAAIRALVWTMERTGSRRDDAVRALRDLGSDPEVSYYVNKKLKELGVQ